ncbi:MAG: MBOAT family protein [Lachnospiraceae bacterium]|nr:MBOAT family protein [Lachnospiraceae bacterium]
MLFTSYEFIGFLAILFLLYYTVCRKMQWGLLLVASYIFYAVANPLYLVYICLTTLTIYGCGIVMQGITNSSKAYLASVKDTIEKSEKKQYKAMTKKRKRRYLVLCLVINFGILLGVKYTNFFIANINNLSGAGLTFVNIALPLGISFYTLQAVSYVVDVYREATVAENNLGKLALFVSFFPQLIQGPISRFGDLSKTLYIHHDFDSKTFFFGLQRILWGFFKKLVIADRVSAGVLTIIGDSNRYQGGYVLAVLFMYTLQLYADFTGGIDITIGIAQALGIEVKENFNRPYFSKTLKEYWRRWHITMCEWFRNYVFYPVSTSKGLQNFTKFTRKTFGDKVGRRIPVYLASLVTWFATGIWHGASWNFIVWGLANWLLLMIGEEMEGWSDGLNEKYNLRTKTGFKVFRVLRTFLLVTALNLFDCYQTVGETIGSFFSIFTAGNLSVLTDGSLLEVGLSAADFGMLIVGVIVLLTVSLIQRKGSVRELIATKPYAARAAIWGILIVVILIFGTYGIGYDSAQFIYNRF